MATWHYGDLRNLVVETALEASAGSPVWAAEGQAVAEGEGPAGGVAASEALGGLTGILPLPAGWLEAPMQSDGQARSWWGRCGLASCTGFPRSPSPRPRLHHIASVSTCHKQQTTHIPKAKRSPCLITSRTITLMYGVVPVPFKVQGAAVGRCSRHAKPQALQ